MFGRKKRVEVEFDRENMKPVLRCSICNGEQVFGFKNIHTGEFIEVSYIASPSELQKYLKLYNIDYYEKEY